MKTHAGAGGRSMHVIYEKNPVALIEALALWYLSMVV